AQPRTGGIDRVPRHEQRVRDGDRRGLRVWRRDRPGPLRRRRRVVHAAVPPRPGRWGADRVAGRDAPRRGAGGVSAAGRGTEPAAAATVTHAPAARTRRDQGRATIRWWGNQRHERPPKSFLERVRALFARDEAGAGASSPTVPAPAFAPSPTIAEQVAV